MDLDLLAISLPETEWLIATFLLGLAAYKLGLPPMVGFLGIGFILKGVGYDSSHALQEIADLGVTLMLFTIGLKLDIKSLLRVQVWGVASAHMAITIIIYASLFFALSFTGFSSFAGIDLWTGILIAFSGAAKLLSAATH